MKLLNYNKAIESLTHLSQMTSMEQSAILVIWTTKFPKCAVQCTPTVKYRKSDGKGALEFIIHRMIHSTLFYIG